MAYFVVRCRRFVDVVRVTSNERRFADAEVAEDEDLEEDFALQRILKRNLKRIGLLNSAKLHLPIRTTNLSKMECSIIFYSPQVQNNSDASFYTLEQV